MARPWYLKRGTRRFARCRCGDVGGTGSVDPAFLSTYIASICGKMEGPILQNCMASLYVPPLEEQFKIMDVLRNVSEMVDITPIMGSLMNLLVHGKNDEFRELLAAFLEHQTHIEKIKSMVEDAMPIIVDIVEV